jgi:hypothetical protein
MKCFQLVEENKLGNGVDFARHEIQTSLKQQGNAFIK